MKRVLMLVLAALAIATSATAQDANKAYDGKWLVKIALDNYRGEADVVIEGNAGTYKRRVAGRRDDPCVGREVPIEITAATAEGLEYMVYGSKALKGCPDGKVTLKRLPDGTLDGQASNGARMTHIRQ